MNIIKIIFFSLLLFLTFSISAQKLPDAPELDIIIKEEKVIISRTSLLNLLSYVKLLIEFKNEKQCFNEKDDLLRNGKFLKQINYIETELEESIEIDKKEFTNFIEEVIELQKNSRPRITQCYNI